MRLIGRSSQVTPSTCAPQSRPSMLLDAVIGLHADTATSFKFKPLTAAGKRASVSVVPDANKSRCSRNSRATRNERTPKVSEVIRVLGPGISRNATSGARWIESSDTPVNACHDAWADAGSSADNSISRRPTIPSGPPAHCANAASSRTLRSEVDSFSFQGKMFPSALHSQKKIQQESEETF